MQDIFTSCWSSKSNWERSSVPSSSCNDLIWFSYLRRSPCAEFKTLSCNERCRNVLKISLNEHPVKPFLPPKALISMKPHHKLLPRGSTLIRISLQSEILFYAPKTQLHEIKLKWTDNLRFYHQSHSKLTKVQKVF